MSCQKEESAIEHQPVSIGAEALEQLRVDFVNLNNATFEDADTRIRWFRWVFVGVADAVGAIMPGAGFAGAISLSTLTWNLLKEEINNKAPQTEIAVYSQSIALSSAINSTYSNAGTVHNTVIINLYNQYGDDLFAMDNISLIMQINLQLAIVTGDNTYRLLSPYTVYETIQPAIYAYSNNIENDLDGFVSDMQNLYPSRSGELSVYLEIMRGLSISRYFK